MVPAHMWQISIPIQISHNIAKVLGAILSHGYMSCGFLSARAVLPVLAHVLLGVDVQIPVNITIDAF